MRRMTFCAAWRSAVACGSGLLPGGIPFHTILYFGKGLMEVRDQVLDILDSD